MLFSHLTTHAVPALASPLFSVGLPVLTGYAVIGLLAFGAVAFGAVWCAGKWLEGKGR